MATRWTTRLNPATWLTRRRPREAPVAPGGRHEFATPAEYISTSQDDYSAADRPTNDDSLEWFAEEDDGQFSATHTQPHPKSQGVARYGRPRTVHLEYDEDHMKLRVSYFSGGTYEYDGVDMEVWQGISTASSTGKWIDANLRPIYDGVKV